MADYWSQWGGKSAYITSQQKRYKEAKRTGNTELMRRLEADAARVGYSLPKTTTTQKTTTTPKTTTTTTTSTRTTTPSVMDYAKQIQQAQAKYASATTQAEREAAHRQAEAARQAAARAGISQSALEQARLEAWKQAAAPTPTTPATAAATPAVTSAPSGVWTLGEEGYMRLPGELSAGGAGMIGGVYVNVQPGYGAEVPVVTPFGDLVYANPTELRSNIVNVTPTATPGMYEATLAGAPGNRVVISERGLKQVFGEVQPQQPVQPQLPARAPDFTSILDQIQQLASGALASAETAPLVKQFYDQTLAAIAEAEQRLLGTLQQQMGGVDPATQAALASLRQTVQRQRENLMEEMSRRGLLQSGIWLEMESRLAQGEMTETQKLLAQQLSNLQNQLVNALATFGQLRVQAAQQFGIEGLRQIESEAQRRQQALTEGLRQAWEAYKYEREYPLKEWETYGPYFVPKASERLGQQQWLTETFEKAPPTSGQAATGGTAVQPDTTLVQSRAYAAARGATVDWDPNTKEVIVNGVRIKPDQITEDGKSWVQKWKMDMALGYL